MVDGLCHSYNNDNHILILEQMNIYTRLSKAHSHTRVIEALHALQQPHSSDATSQTDTPHPFVDFLGYPSLNHTGGNLTAMPQPFDNLPKDPGSPKLSPSTDRLIATTYAVHTPQTIDYSGLLWATPVDEPTPSSSVTPPNIKKVLFIDTPATPSTDPMCTHPLKNPPPNLSTPPPD
jgi:hypothetical protein